MSLLIIGAGEQGRVVLEAARAAGLEPAGFVEPALPGWNPSGLTEVAGLPILGRLDEPDDWRAWRRQHGVVVAVGDNRSRAEVHRRCTELELPLRAVIHPRAVVLGGASIREGAVVLAGAVIGVDARVGSGAIVNTAASVDHDTDIGAFAHIAPGAHLAGRVAVGEGALIGVGAAIRDGVRVGSWSVVGAGAAVVADVPDGSRVVGVPARPLEMP